MNASNRRSLVAALIALGAVGAHAADATAEPRPFRRDTWASLVAKATHPTAVVFTTTDCAHCPAVFTQVARAIRERKANATLIGVVMDDASGDELMRHPHYRLADRLYVFAEAPLALRYAVNPAWRGVTPYVALLSPGRAPTWITGAPAKAQIDTWLPSTATP